MQETLHNKKCFNSHTGLWACKADVLESKRAAIAAGHIRAVENPEAGELSALAEPFVVNEHALIYIDDVMMKRRSKYGGVSTIGIRRQMRWARENAAKLKGVIFYMDTPGGHVDGQEELLYELDALKKVLPTYSYASDMCCSAGYWFAAKTGIVFAGKLSALANIGAFAAVIDTSAAYEAAGIKVIPVRSGAKKGLGIEGVPVDDEVIAVVQEEVNLIAGYFIEDVKAGRPKWNGDKADGSVMFGEEALAMGLIDGIGSFDQFLETVTQGGQMTKEEPQEQVVRLNSDEPKPQSEALPHIDGEVKLSETGAVAAVVIEEDGKEEEDDELERLRDENARLKKSIEEMVKDKGEEEDDNEKKSAAAEQALFVKMKAMVAAAGGSTSAENLSELVAQLSALGNGSDGPPVKTANDNVPTKAAAYRVLREYQKKHGAFDGGAKFRIEKPELYKQIVS